MSKIAPELKPIYEDLKKRGFRVFTFYNQEREAEIKGLIWEEDERIYIIQPSSWWYPYARERWTIGLELIPSRKYGSSINLVDTDIGVPASELMKYKNAPLPRKLYKDDIGNYIYKTLDENFLSKHTYITEIKEGTE